MSENTLSANVDTDVPEIKVNNNDETADHTAENINQGTVNPEDLNKSGNSTNCRNKNRKRKRHHNNNKNNKKWCKKFKRQSSQQQHNNKSDPENSQNVKNSNNNRKHLYGGQKHLKSIFKNISHRNHRGISKFFLPDKRLRAELIVPPTKFLLGGNISDPLNLNSLQDEALNTSENAATPKSSPITTPPKIEVIIPPNIFDPLNLLDAVDTAEYEKLLTTPLKRRMKHRNRKKKPRKRYDSSSSTAVSSTNNVSNNTSVDTIEATPNDNKAIDGKEAQEDITANNVSLTLTPSVSERAVKDLRLDLFGESDSNSNRKRKIVECPNNHKKARRMDSMDKIVSPVIPQPGAWKRPPPIVPMGAPRNRNRIASSSTSEIDPVSTVTPEIQIEKETTPSSSSLCTSTVQPSVTFATTANQVKADKQPPKGRPEKSKYQHGNFRSFDSFAALRDCDDVRLKVFKEYPYLFQNKDVLDIGCHAGHLTLAIARTLNPKSVLGIDIDKSLILRAQHNQSLFVKIEPNKPNTINTPNSTENNATNSSKKKKNKRDRTKTAAYYPISFGITYKGIPQIPIQINDQTTSATIQSKTNEFPNNVQFKTMNYVEIDEALTNDAQQYDLIICLSVTKFIHLNFGDAGLKCAFKRMFNQLRPGGKLILEAQNWASYKISKNLTQTTLNNYKSIEFFPNKFHEFLLSTEVGFSHTRSLAILKHVKGFRRPLQLYVKGDFTPSQICWSDSYIPQTPYEQPYRAYYAQIRRPRTVQNSVWASDTHTPHPSSRYTPSQGLSSTSQYYNPLETDNYLPSYDNEIQTRHYCFVSPLYSTVWSPPPSGRRSASQTPLFGSIRRVDETDDNIRPHVYLPTAGSYGRDSSRSIDDCSQSPQTSHVYAAATPESRSVRETDTEYCSPKEHVYATACDNSSSSPHQYSGESSRSVEIEQEDYAEDTVGDGYR